VAVPLAGLFPAPLRLPATIAFQGAVVLLGLRVLLRLRGQRWRDLGLHRPRLIDPLRGLLVLLACLLVNGLFTLGMLWRMPRALEAHFEVLHTLGEALTAGLSLGSIGALMGLVGFYEELLARGLLLGRCRIVFGRWWPALLVSSLLFGLAHLYQGWVGAVQTMLVGIVFAAFTIRWGTLWPAILAHAGLNLASLLVLEGLPATG
jgi:uncharacterized protein